MGTYLYQKKYLLFILNLTGHAVFSLATLLPAYFLCSWIEMSGAKREKQ